MHRFFQVALWLLGAGLCLVFASHASAQQDEWDDAYNPFAREGIFLGIGGLLALENFDRDAAIAPDPALGDNDLAIGGDDGGGFELRAGYRVDEYFAAELLFQYYANFSINERVTGQNDTFDGWSLTANAKGYPLLGRLQPYALAGIGALVFTEKRGEDLDFVVRVGGGVDVYLSDSLLLGLEVVYVLPAGSLDDYQFTTFTAGIQYRY